MQALSALVGGINQPEARLGADGSHLAGKIVREGAFKDESLAACDALGANDGEGGAFARLVDLDEIDGDDRIGMGEHYLTSAFVSDGIRRPTGRKTTAGKGTHERRFVVSVFC